MSRAQLKRKAVAYARTLERKALSYARTLECVLHGLSLLADLCSVVG